MAYSDADLIRGVATEFFNATDFLDAALVLFATNHGDPELDGLLLARGFTVPASVPALVASWSSWLATAYAMESAISQRQVTLDDDDQPERLRKRVHDGVEMLDKGEIAIDGMARASGKAKFQVDSDPETLGEFAVVVDTEENWQQPTEDRE